MSMVTFVVMTALASTGPIVAPPTAGATAAPGAPAPPPSTTPDADRPELSPKERLIAFNAAFDAGLAALGSDDEAASAVAVESFAEALRLMPESAESAYNLGLALARHGAFTEAAEAFEKAAARGDAILAGHAMFNQGNAGYALALEQLKSAAEANGTGGGAAPSTAVPAPGPSPAAGAAPKPEQIIGTLERALRHYKDAAAALPGDRDPRANAERTRKLIDELKRQQEQQQQQQQQQQQKDDQQQKQDQQQKSDQQQKQDQQQKSDQQQKQDQQQKSDQQQKQDQQQKSDEQQKQDQQQKSDEQQKQDQQQKSDQQQSDQQPQAGDQQPPSTQRVQMTRDEMERLLQAVRDREHARRARLEAAKPQRRGNPGGKDW